MSDEVQTYELSEVAAHNTREDLWMVIEGKVYDVTKFLDEHPGGEEVMIEQGGKLITTLGSHRMLTFFVWHSRPRRNRGI